ncbi:MAG: hypothetical protein AB7S26_25590 [Sandaracinaceae bacterium]
MAAPTLRAYEKALREELTRLLGGLGATPVRTSWGPAMQWSFDWGWGRLVGVAANPVGGRSFVSYSVRVRDERTDAIKVARGIERPERADSLETAVFDAAALLAGRPVPPAAQEPHGIDVDGLLGVGAAVARWHAAVGGEIVATLMSWQDRGLFLERLVEQTIARAASPYVDAVELATVSVVAREAALDVWGDELASLARAASRSPVRIGGIRPR